MQVRSFGVVSVVFGLLLISKAGKGALVHDATFTATGVENTMSITQTITGPAEVACVVEWNDDTTEVHIINITAIPEITKSFATYGVVNTHLACFGPAEFATATDESYVGTAITGLDVYNGTTNLFVSVLKSAIDSGEDVILDVYFETGLDVIIELTLIGVPSAVIPPMTNASNGSNFFTLDNVWFTEVGLYALEVNVSNPLSELSRHTLIAVQNAVDVGTVSMTPYTALVVPTEIHHLLVNSNVNVDINLNAGDDLTFTVTILDPLNATVRLYVDHCNGTVPSHTLSLECNQTGSFTIVIEVSNFVSIHTVTIPAFFTNLVNDLTFAIDDAEVMNTDSVTFTVEVLNTAELAMGNVNCLLTYDSSTSETISLDMTETTYGSLVATSNTSTRTFLASWYSVFVLCSNELPPVVNGVTTTMNFTELLIVENDVTTLTMVTNSPNETYHPMSQALELSISNTNPGTDLPLANVSCEFVITGDTSVTVVCNGTVDAASNITCTHKFSVPDVIYDATLTCSNRQTNKVMTLTGMEVYSDCWESVDFFDPSYRKIDNPILSFTHEDYEMTGNVRMSGMCNGTYVTIWTIWSVDPADGSVIEMKENITNINIQTFKIYGKNTIDPGYYRFGLTTQFSEWPGFPANMDYSYVKFQFASLVPVLTDELGGKNPSRTVHVSSIVVIDSSLSEDPGKLLPSLAGAAITKTWSCLTGTQITDDDVKAFFSSNVTIAAANTNCDNLIPNPGGDRQDFPSDTFVVNQWYVFRMEWTKGTRTGTATQALYPVPKPTLELTIKCKTNCKLGDDGTFVKLAVSDLNMNVAILTEGVDNSTASYQWTIERDFNNTGIFTDVTASIAPTDKVGLLVPGSFLGSYDLSEETVYYITCQVTAADDTYAATKISKTFIMNLAPHSGSCSFKVNEAIINPGAEVQAGVTSVCFACSLWKDEGFTRRRDPATDAAGLIMYDLKQKFLDANGSINKSIDTVSLGRLASTSGCLLVSLPPAIGHVNNALFEVHVSDYFENPVSVTPLSVTVTSPIRDVQATSETELVGDVDNLLTSNEDALNTLIEQSDASGIATVTTAILSCLAIETPVEAEPDLNNPQLLIDSGQTEDDVINSLISESKPSTLSLKLQEASQNVVESILSVVNGTNTTKLADPELGTQLLSTINTLAEGSQDNINANTMNMAVDIMSSVTNTVDSVLDQDFTPVVGELFSTATKTFDSVAKMVVPKEAAEQEAVASPGDVRKQKEALMAFASEDDLEARENSLFSDDEKVFMELKNQQKIALEMEEKKATALKAFEDKKKFEEAVVGNAEKTMSDGSVKSFGTEQAKMTLTRNTAEQLTKDGGLKTDLTSVKLNLDKVEDGKEKFTVFVSEMTSPLVFDENGWAGKIKGQKGLIIDTSIPLTERVTITHKSTPATFEVIVPTVSEEDASGPWSYHQVFVNSADEDLNFAIKKTSDSVKYNIYIAYEGYVSKFNHVAMHELTGPDTPDAILSTAFKPKERPGRQTGVWKVGIENIVQESGGDSRRKRRAATNDTGPAIPNYHIAMTTTACLVWDEGKKEWTTNECEGTYNPETGDLDCSCRPQKKMTFANSFYVPPNKIDFSSVFLKFSPLNQAAVMATLILIFIIYIITIIWARRQDKKDLLKWGITPLSDNFAEDNYFYVIKVITGMRPSSGTRSKVCMVVAGDEMDSGIREIYDGVRREFATGSVMNFLMSTNVYLGELEYIRVWHDNSGGGNLASWYLSRVEIQDVQRHETFVFLSERWLAVEKDDGLLDCVLPVCKTDNLNIFSNRFFLNAKDNLADSHLWVSVVYRPQSSSFTRCQRTSCALVFVMLTMISNAMFFKSSGDDGNIETPSELQVGPFRFSLQQIYISVICALIVTPPSILLIYLFKMSRPKPYNKDAAIYKPRDRPSRYKIPLMQDWLDREQKRSMELEKHLVQKGYPSMEGFKLSHWCMYIGWLLVVVTTFLCSFFVMLYSMEWGKKKSEEWITTFLMSFFESVLCLDPVKVGIMALVFALIFRSTKGSKADITRSTIMRKYSSNMRSKSGGLRLPAPPLDHKKIEKEREDRKREILMKRAFRDCIVNFIIIWILFSIAYSNRDNRSYEMHRETMSMFMEPLKLPSFSKIKSTNDYYRWLNESVLPAMFPQTDVTGTTLHWRRRQFVADGAKFRVGPPRLRQLRTTEQSCSNKYFNEQHCYRKYSERSEDTRNYCIGWKIAPCDPKDAVYSFTSDAWKFTSALDIWGIPLSGTYTTYGGGGYIAKLDVNLQISQEVIDELYVKSWVDRQTRAVILEFTLYCLNTNIFTYNMFMVEFPETGGAFPFYTIYPMKVYQHLGPMGIYTLACEVMFVFYLLIMTILFVIGVVQEKKDYFKKPWQIFDLIFMILSYVCIIMYIIRFVMTNQSLAVFKEDKKAFVNFYHVALWNQMLVLLIGALSFMATLRLLNVLGYNKRIGAVARVFSRAASDLIWFGIFFINVFTCYCVFGYLLFGSKLNSYKTVFKVMGTLFISMIGKSKFTEIDSTDPILSKIYFIIFIFFVVYMILTMFLAMLSKAIDEVHADTKKSKDDEMVDYVLRKVKNIMSYGTADNTVPGNAIRPASGLPPAPWNRPKRGKRHELDNRQILEDIRSSLNDAIAGNARDFTTPISDKKKCKVSIRK